MTAFWEVLAAVIEVVRWLTTPPVTLADAAAREAIRRAVTGPSVAAYSNATLPSRVASIVDAPASGPTGVMPTGRGDEQVWRRRVEELNRAVRTDTGELADVESRLAWLEQQAAARDDPAQRAELIRQAQRAREALADVRRRLDEHEARLETRREEARRLDVPPGWLR